MGEVGDITTGKFEKVETIINNEPVSIETGYFARQASGAVIVRQGETAVFVAAVVAEEAQADVDFLPLTVEYREKTYAYGKIPGGFVKREGKPSVREILVSRLIDRPLRPLFPKGFFNDIVITALTLSADDKYDPDPNRRFKLLINYLEHTVKITHTNGTLQLKIIVIFANTHILFYNFRGNLCPLWQHHSQFVQLISYL